MPAQKGNSSAAAGVGPNVILAVTASGVMAGAGFWAALAFVFNLLWEIGQVRLYTFWAAADGMTVTWALLHCTLGDVLIALALFTVAGITLRRFDWPASRPWVGSAIVVLGGLAYTAWSEWFNVYRAGNWGYTASMPMIFGIGLTPLLQWLILPPVMVGAYRRLGSALFSAKADSAHDLSRNPS